MGVNLRVYETKDKDEVIKVISAGYESVGLSINLYFKDSDLMDIGANYIPPDSQFWVMDLDGVIAGTCAIRKKTEELAELGRQYVRPPYHHKGVGRSMLNEAIRFAKKRGYKKLELFINPAMKQARELYESYGFTFQGERTSPIWGLEHGFTLII